MGERIQRFKRAVITAYLIALHLALLFFAVVYYYPDFRLVSFTTVPVVREPLAATPAPTPLPIPSEFADPPDQARPTPDSNAAAPPDVLMIPVKGVTRAQLQDTFTFSRGEGRTHDAIDIIAPLGTPVLAVADGRILKFHDSIAGGTTIYQISADQKYIYYYAHLQRRADGLAEQDPVKRGTIIGYVGDTGNAGAGNFHLHFTIATPTDPKRFWNGPYINPYPLLLHGIESP